MARNFTKTADLGFEMDTWESTAGEICRNGHAPGLRRCAHPDCRRPFRPGKPWAEFCCAPCRQADTEERRRIGHLLATPAMIARQHKHAKKGSREALLSGMARTYADQLTTAWLEARARRAAEAEAANPLA